MKASATANGKRPNGAPARHAAAPAKRREYEETILEPAARLIALLTDKGKKTKAGRSLVSR